VLPPTAFLLLLHASGAQARRSLTLADALQQARRNRTEVRQAAIDVERAGVSLMKAYLERVRFTLQASVSEQYQAQNQQITGGDLYQRQLCTFSPGACAAEAHPFNLQAALTVPIWSGFQVEADAARARALKHGSESDALTTDQSVAMDVTRAYWAVRRAELLVDVEERAVQAYDTIEHIARLRAQGGVVPQIDANRALVSALRERSQLAAVVGQVSQSRALFALALQIPEQPELTDDPLGDVPLPSLEESLRAARRSRPELRSLAYQAEAASEAVRAARAAYWPQLSGFATATLRNAKFVAGMNMELQEQLLGDFVAGLQVKWLIFDTLVTYTAVKDAEYVRDRAALDQVKEAYQVESDVRTAHAKLKALKEQRVQLDRVLTTAKENVEILRRRYQVGAALMIEVLDGQAAELRAESDSVGNATDLSTAVSELRAAEGRL
jgi:outer membrane protein